MLTASIDTSGLQFVLGGLQNALIGTGGDVSTIIKDESKLLALEIAKHVGPKSKQQKTKSIPKEVGRVFMPKPAINWGAKKQGDGSMIWLDAGPEFLTGIRRERYDIQINSIKSMYQAYLKAPNQTLGKKYSLIGMCGKQHVQEINRIMVKRGVFKEFVAFMIGHIGRMKASFFMTAKKIEPSLVAPQWIEKHITGGKNPKNITDLSGLENLESPSVTFGSNAIGIGKFEGVIQSSVKIREYKVAARLRLVLSGYSKDVAAGIRPRKHAKESHES